MWLEGELDADSEEGREQMMLALDEAEHGCAAVPADAPPPTRLLERPRAAGYSFNDGPPRLRSSLPWGAFVLRQMMPPGASHSVLRDTAVGWHAFWTRSELTVHVDWGGLEPSEVQGVPRLSVRHMGVELSSTQGLAGAPLSLTFSVRDLAPGEVVVACLRWESGSRHLHCVVPLREPIRLDGLLALPPFAGEPCGIAAAPDQADAPRTTVGSETTSSSDVVHSSSAAPLEGRAHEPSSNPHSQLPPLRRLPDRALGIEIEVLTLSPTPRADGAWRSKLEELQPRFLEAAQALMQGVYVRPCKTSERTVRAEPTQLPSTGQAASPLETLTAQIEHMGVPCPPDLPPDSVPWCQMTASYIASRCMLWQQEPDDHISYCSEDLATQVLRRAGGLPSWGTDVAASTSGALEPDGGMCLLSGGRGIMKTEFKSPPPTASPTPVVSSSECAHMMDSSPAALLSPSPDCARASGSRSYMTSFTASAQHPGGAYEGALNLAKGGVMEMRAFLHAVRISGAGAPPISEATGHAATSFHVHVNVRSDCAGGQTLRARELLAVWAAWVRYDLVTMRFARPWTWREPWAAPLYATGAEFGWQERVWEQGSAPPPPPARAGYADVVVFVRAVRAALISEDYRSAKDEATRVSLLFGVGNSTPATLIGRCCSLNLRRVTTLGTLEFRRFHSSLNDALLLRWVHFCCSFVERFRCDAEGVVPLFDWPDEADALQWLVHQQEVATPDMLMAEMEDWLDTSTASYFMKESGALP